MKIVILCTPLEAGGAQRAAIRLVAEMRKRNIDAENWFLYKKREIFTDTPNLHIILNRNLNSGIDYIGIIFKLYKEIKRNKPDVLITFTHYSNIIGQTIAWLCNVKTRISSHRNVSDKDMSNLLMRIDNICAKTGIYTHITAVSESTKNSFNYYPEKTFNKVKVIHNGLTFIPSELTITEARQKLGLPTDGFVIGNIGRLSVQKNQKLLLKAIQSLDKVYLAIVGEGEIRNEIEEMINTLGLNNRVYLLGEIPFSDIPVFLKALDIFVMPSLYEGLSNALVEALKAGLPIIASDVESQRDVIVDTNGTYSGILLPVTDEQLWEEAIRELCLNNDKKADLSAKALIRSNDFTMENMADNFLNLVY